jgi:hypothetical protein
MHSQLSRVPARASKAHRQQKGASNQGLRGFRVYGLWFRRRRRRKTEEEMKPTHNRKKRV